MFDRENQATPRLICGVATPSSASLCGAAGGLWMERYSSTFDPSNRSLFGSTTFGRVSLDAGFVNGWGIVDFNDPSLFGLPERKLLAPAGLTTIIALDTGTVTPGATVTYYGLPALGFGAQSYSTTGLPGVNPNVLSNYGGQFGHKIRRRIGIGP